MNKEKFCLSSNVIELSKENPNYLLMTDRVCYYDEPNLNGSKLLSDGAEDYAQTLIDMPVYAKCRVNDKGEPTFGSHELGLDEDGELIFDTTPIGVHVAVEIKDDTVSINGAEKTLPCLFATQKIWTRNKNAVAAIKRLFSEGKLHNSWELQVNEYSYSNGIKTISDYEFVGNTFLGYEYADPAYGESAKVLSISQEEQLMVAEALSKDLIAQKEEEDENLSTENTNPAVEPEVTEVVADPIAEPIEEPAGATVDTPVDGEPNEEPEASEDLENEESQTERDEGEPETTEGDGESDPDTASLTTYDIYEKVREAAQSLLDQWCWPVYVFPEEHIALLKTDNTDDELTYIQVTYTVNADDTVAVSDPVEVKLVVQMSQVNQKIGELQDTIASLNDELSKAKAEIETMKPICEAAQKASHDEKAAELRKYAENSNQFSAEELDSEEMKSLFDALDEAAIKAMIADRVVSATTNNHEETAQTITNSSLYVGEMASADSGATVKQIMSDFLKNKN